MSRKKPQNKLSEDILELEIPRRGMKDHWLIVIAKQYEKFTEVLTTITDPTDPRPALLTRLLISSIPQKEGETTREEIKKKWEEILREKKEKALNNGGLTNEERGIIEIEASIEVLGYITDWFDEHLGITHKIEIMVS